MATSRPPTRSRLNQARAAIRPAMKGRVMLSGPSGAGKTYTSLLIATYLVGPEGRVLHIDTEKESSLTYADVFQFEHLRWNAPFDPASLSMTILEAGDEYDAIIVDSFSHFWRKQGGVLDIANGRFTGWKDARPMQEDVTEAILEVDAHVIVCCRSKMEHVQTNENGKIEVVKIGMKAQQDDDLEYEVNISLEVDMQHTLAVSKSRTSVIPVGHLYRDGHAGDFASQYRDWLAGGEPVAARADTDALAATLNSISDDSERLKAKLMFLDAFGRPEFLLVSRLDEARQWCAERAAGLAPPADRGEDDVPPDDGGHEQPSEEPPAVSSSERSEARTAQTAAEPSPSSSATSTAAEDRTSKKSAAEQVAELQETLKRTDARTAEPDGADSQADESSGAEVGQTGATPEVVELVEHFVKEQSLVAISKTLTAMGKSQSGTPAKQRARLRDVYLNIVERIEADPTTCKTCGGYDVTPPPFLTDRPRCECPI